MIMAGGRQPMKITYSVGFKSNGKITALQLDILINAGLSVDISPMMPHNMMGALKKYDWGALSFDIKVCKTNHSSRSATTWNQQESFIPWSAEQRKRKIEVFTWGSRCRKIKNKKKKKKDKEEKTKEAAGKNKERKEKKKAGILQKNGEGRVERRGRRATA
jgi:hypothetical protein